MEHIYPYILLSLLSIAVILFGKNKYIYWGFLGVLVLFGGLRGFLTGGDTFFYYEIGYKSIAEGHFFTSMIKFPEFGYSLLNYIVYLLGGNYRIFLMLHMVCVLSPVFWLAKKYSKNPHYVVSFYVLLYFYLFGFCFMRQICAVSFLLCAYVLLAKEKNKKKYILLVGLATLFHSSSIIALIVLLFHRKKFDPIWGTIVLVLSYFVGRSGLLTSLVAYIVSLTKYGLYIGHAGGSFSLNGFLVTIFYSWLLFQKKLDPIFCYILVIGYTIFNLTIFSMDLARIAWSFTIISVFILGEICSRRKKRLLFVVVIYSFSVYYNYLYTNQGNVIPYEMTLDSEPKRHFMLEWNKGHQW